MNALSKLQHNKMNCEEIEVMEAAWLVDVKLWYYHLYTMCMLAHMPVDHTALHTFLFPCLRWHHKKWEGNNSGPSLSGTHENTIISFPKGCERRDLSLSLLTPTEHWVTSFAKFFRTHTHPSHIPVKCGLLCIRSHWLVQSNSTLYP